jgi:hypothetical protein
MSARRFSATVQRDVIAGSWFCAVHQDLSVLDSLWIVCGRLLRLGDMSREEARALMDGYMEEAARVRTREIAEQAATQRKPE